MKGSSDEGVAKRRTKSSGDEIEKEERTMTATIYCHKKKEKPRKACQPYDTLIFYRNIVFPQVCRNSGKNIYCGKDTDYRIHSCIIELTLRNKGGLRQLLSCLDPLANMGCCLESQCSDYMTYV